MYPYLKIKNVFDFFERDLWSKIAKTFLTIVFSLVSYSVDLFAWHIINQCLKPSRLCTCECLNGMNPKQLFNYQLTHIKAAKLSSQVTEDLGEMPVQGAVKWCFHCDAFEIHLSWMLKDLLDAVKCVIRYRRYVTLEN